MPEKRPSAADMWLILFLFLCLAGIPLSAQDSGNAGENAGKAVRSFFNDLGENAKGFWNGITGKGGEGDGNNTLLLIAVPELEGTKQVPADVVISATGALTTGLLENRQIKSIVDHNQINRIMKQHKFEASDWSNPEKYAEIGKALNVDTICIGKIALAWDWTDSWAYSGSGKGYEISVQLIDINSMGIIGAFSSQQDGWNLTDYIKKEAKNMKIKM